MPNFLVTPLKIPKVSQPIGFRFTEAEPAAFNSVAHHDSEENTAHDCLLTSFMQLCI